MLTLADAIINEKIDQVKEYLDSHTDINQLDEYGFTPLIEAGIADNLEIAKLLIAYGADVNLQDIVGGSALHWACENNNIQLTQLLLDQNADPNIYTFAGQPALVMPLLRQQKTLKKLLLKYGANLDFAQDYINAKLLGHIFELVGTANIVDPHNNFVELDFEGFYLEFSLAIITDSLDQYRKNFAARHHRQYEQYTQTIVDVMHRAAKLATYQQYRIDLERYDLEINHLINTEPLIIPIGYEGHAITLIKAGNILVKCDRREESRFYDNVMFYQIGHPHYLTTKFIKDLMYIKQPGEFINSELHTLLALKPITELKVAAQISGNCSWANVEACIPALFFLLFSHLPDFQVNISRYKNMSLQFFHQWREWNKSRTLSFCIQSFKKAKPIRKACKAEILAAILFQACKGNNLLEQERMQLILPLLNTPRYKYILQNYIKTYCYEDLSEEGKAWMNLLKEHGYMA